MNKMKENIHKKVTRAMLTKEKDEDDDPEMSMNKPSRLGSQIEEDGNQSISKMKMTKR
jgi:hypothetical protein